MILTPQEATAIPCPVSRTFAQAQATCRADGCILWRWQAVSVSDPRWKAAMAARMQETGEKAPGREAAAWVRDNVPLPPERGWCGLGGRPEA